MEFIAHFNSARIIVYVISVIFREMSYAVNKHGSRSANATPTSTPSPKKRHLPAIPLPAQQISRDRGKNGQRHSHKTWIIYIYIF